MADEATRKTPKAMAMSTAPDVCKTPSGPSLIPVPYPIVGMFNLSAATKPTVLFTKEEAFTTGSKITKVIGDEAGVGGGVKSGVNISTCEFITYSTTVMAGGENIVRHNDTMWMNNQNTTGKVVFPIGLSANVSPSGGIPDDTDPEPQPETPQEAAAQKEKKGFWASAWDGAKENVQGKWEGIKDAASDPGKAIGDFAGGVKEAVMHPIETGKKIGGAIKDTANEAYDAYQTGDMDKLGKMAGSGAVELGIGLAGTKGLDKLGRAAKLGKLGKKAPGQKAPDIDVPGGKKPDVNLPVPDKPKIESPKSPAPDIDAPGDRGGPSMDTSGSDSPKPAPASKPEAPDKPDAVEPKKTDGGDGSGEGGGGDGSDGTVVTELPGPTLPPKVANTFKDGKYKNRKLEKDEKFYKYHGKDNRTGKKTTWFSNKKYATEAELRSDLAIRDDWGVKIDKVSEFNVPKGTWVSEGAAAAQGAGYAGGGYQAVVTNAPRSWITNTKPAF